MFTSHSMFTSCLKIHQNNLKLFSLIADFFFTDWREFRKTVLFASSTSFRISTGNLSGLLFFHPWVLSLLLVLIVSYLENRFNIFSWVISEQVFEYLPKLTLITCFKYKSVLPSTFSLFSWFQLRSTYVFCIQQYFCSCVDVVVPLVCVMRQFYRLLIAHNFTLNDKNFF